MLSPFTGKEMTIQKEWRSMTYKKEAFRVCFHTWKCENTGEQFEDEHFAQLNYDQVQNQYRAKYAIPYKEEIISIREKYELSALKMSQILGFGDNTYRQYEAGEMPTQSNARLILVASNPVEFRHMVRISNIDETLREKLNKRIEHLIRSEMQNSDKQILSNYFFGVERPSIDSGFRMPDMEKFGEMVLFFAERVQPWKTKLNKLLFYADFMCFGATGKSISGIKYRAIPMGPVPDKFQTLFEFLSNTNVVDITASYFCNGGIGEQFFPAKGRKFNTSLFTEQEKNVLCVVAEKFQTTTTDEIIEISHKEKGWIENIGNHALINYLYAFDLTDSRGDLESPRE
jgi:putative zinc finger/helix-turn-helix YgiT family protein